MQILFMRPAPPATALLAVAALLLASGCDDSAVELRADSPANDVPAAADEPSGVSGGTNVASKRPATNPLDAERAFEYLKQLCNLGPRPSGSVGMARQQTLLVRFFEGKGAKVSRQQFTVRHPLTGKPVSCANLVIEWHPEKSDRVLLCAHYDTRPLPDQDPNPRRRRDGLFVGANDGASGVAVLMELAHFVPELETDTGVDFVLFDAEELVFGSGVGERGEYFLGSTFFAQQYRQASPPHKYHWGVLLDMVGDAELELLQERYSVSWPDTRPLVIDIWNIAASLGVEEFVPRTKRGRNQGFIRDDHIPLRNIARIPTCNIIDAEYPDAPFGHPGSYWHTEQDVPSNCSSESLAKVGWVVLEWLRSVQIENRR